MIILAIETSTTHGSIALLQDGNCLLTRNFTSERSHNSQIFAPLEEALAIAIPDLIAVGTGPGSYTGARIGIAAAIGISLTHNARLIGIPSVTAASNLSSYHLIGDARRSSYFYAQVENHQLLSDPQLIDQNTLTALTKSGQHLITFDPTPPADGIEQTLPAAKVIAEIAQSLTETQIEALAAAPVVPHYMSAPFVTPAKKRPTTKLTTPPIKQTPPSAKNSERLPPDGATGSNL